jgi:hypothetical protein
MTNRSPQLRVAFIALTLLVSVAFRVTANAQGLAANTPSINSISWNMTNAKAPLLVLPDHPPNPLDALLAYPTTGFAFPLIQPLYYGEECDCYVFTIMAPENARMQLLQLWRTPAGGYKSLREPVLELEDADTLKTVIAPDKTKFLFAEVAKEEWRCVAIHDQRGNYLLIDYKADGTIERLRDSFSRSVVFNYSNGRVVSFTQIWPQE